MYKIGKHNRHWKRKFFVISSLLIISAIIVGGIALLLRENAKGVVEVQDSGAQSRAFVPANQQTRLNINEPTFTMQLPGDWREISRNKDSRYQSIEWQWQDKIKNRWLTIYIDRIPADMVFNRLMPVEIDSESTLVFGTMSDNCLKFSGAGNPSTSEKKITKVLSKWQNVEFWCDMDNTVDNVVGVGNDVDGTIMNLKGPSSGNHKYLFVYTDRSVPENQDALQLALQTFAAK